MSEKLKIVILAWWNWTRLWPISRENYPKQFNKLESLNWESLFQISLKRAKFLTNAENIFIVVSEKNSIHAENQSLESNIKIKKENFILQPSMKETLPIIALSANKIREWNVLFLTSDHVIEDLPEFKTKIELASSNTNKWIIIFWIKPTKPETGFGYIEKEDSEKVFSKVNRFHEKPTLEIAEKYIEEWFMWNSWMILFNVKIFKNLLKKVNPVMEKLIFDTNISDEEKFDQIEAVSIDNGLIEKINDVYSVNLTNYWTDLWTFDSIMDYNIEKDIENNLIISEWINNNNLVIISDKKKKNCLIDIEDLIIIGT